MKLTKTIFIIIGILFSSIIFADKNKNQDIHFYVQNLTDEALKILHSDTLSKEQKMLKSQNLMSKNLDVNWMAEFSLGRQKKSLSPEQISKFKKVYSKYIVQSYSKKIKDYKGEKIVVNNVKQINENSYAVKTEIQFAEQSNKLAVEFMVRKKDNTFLVFDIVTEGISLITAQRSEFNSVISSQGIDELISILEANTKKIS